MKQAEVMTLLAVNQNERGIQNWMKLGTSKLRSYGIGLTRLRKLAKEIGRNRALSLQLWESDCYDARVIALLIDDPNQITREQAESQVEDLAEGYLAHVFSTCGASLAKSPLALELASEWITSQDEVRRQCGYGLLYEVSKSKKKSAPDDAFFLRCIEHIDKHFKKESNTVLCAMGAALMGIGKRNRTLNAAALTVAKRIGPIPVGGENSQCDPFDVVKHLTGDDLIKRLGITAAIQRIHKYACG